MNFLTLIMPTGVAGGSGSGSKTGSGQGAAGFEQLLLGLIGAAPQAAEGQVQAAAAQVTGAAAALLAGTQANATPAQATTPPVGLVEAAAKAATAGLTAAQTATTEAGKTAVNATGAVSEALLKNGLPGAQPQQPATQAGAATTTEPKTQTPVNAGQTVEQAKTQVAATVESAVKTATTTVQQAAVTASETAAAAQKAAETAAQKSVGAAADIVAKAAGTPAANASAVALDAVSKAPGTPAAPANPNATGAQAATAAAATGVATTTVKATSITADAAGDPSKKAEAPPASLITSSPEVATAKTTIKSAVLQAPGPDAGKQGATSGKEKDANSNAARLRAARTAAPLAGETVAQQAQATAAKSAQQPAATHTPAAASKPADSFVQQVSHPAAGTGDASVIVASGTTGTQLGADVTAAASAAARHGAAHFVPAAEQVALQFSRALASGSDHITIRLEPASLGRVDVQVELTKDGRLTALFIADRPETLDMLQRDARVLERALNEAGIRADTSGLSFSLRGDGGGELPQFANNPGGTGKFSLDGTTDDGGDAAPAVRQAALNADALLDIRV